MPGHLHTTNNVQGYCFEGFFAVCHGKCTRQRAQFRIVFFCRLCIWYPKHYRHFIYITISILCIQRSIADILYYPEMHRCKETLVSFIDNHKFIQIHTSSYKSSSYKSIQVVQSKSIERNSRGRRRRRVLRPHQRLQPCRRLRPTLLWWWWWVLLLLLNPSHPMRRWPHKLLRLLRLLHRRREVRIYWPIIGCR